MVLERIKGVVTAKRYPVEVGSGARRRSGLPACAASERTFDDGVLTSVRWCTA